MIDNAVLELLYYIIALISDTTLNYKGRQYRITQGVKKGNIILWDCTDANNYEVVSDTLSDELLRGFIYMSALMPDDTRLRHNLLAQYLSKVRQPFKPATQYIPFWFAEAPLVYDIATNTLRGVAPSDMYYVLTDELYYQLKCIVDNELLKFRLAGMHRLVEYELDGLTYWLEYNENGFNWVTQLGYLTSWNSLISNYIVVYGILKCKSNNELMDYINSFINLIDIAGRRGRKITKVRSVSCEYRVK